VKTVANVSNTVKNNSTSTSSSKTPTATATSKPAYTASSSSYSTSSTSRPVASSTSSTSTKTTGNSIGSVISNAVKTVANVSNTVKNNSTSTSSSKTPTATVSSKPAYTASSSSYSTSSTSRPAASSTSSTSTKTTGNSIGSVISNAVKTVATVSNTVKNNSPSTSSNKTSTTTASSKPAYTASVTPTKSCIAKNSSGIAAFINNAAKTTVTLSKTVINKVNNFTSSNNSNKTNYTLFQKKSSTNAEFGSIASLITNAAKTAVTLNFNVKNNLNAIKNKNSSWPKRADGSPIINSEADYKLYTARTNSSKEIGGQKIYTKTTPLLDRTELETALKDSGCLKGNTSKTNIDEKLSKTSWEPKSGFGNNKATWQNGVINNENTYVDKTTGLTRVKINDFSKDKANDFYVVAISDRLNKDAYETLKNQNLGMTSDERFNYGGYKFQVTLKDDKGNSYNVNLISGDTKSDVNSYPNDGYFPISRDHNGNVIKTGGKPEYHDHLFEFISNGTPNSSVSTGSNVNYSKLLGLSPNTKLTITEVNLYNDNPLVSGDYIGNGFETYGTISDYGEKNQ